MNCEFANHPSIFWHQRSPNLQIAKSDVLCPRCATQICGFADINKNKHSPHCAAAAATNLAAAPKKRCPRPRPRYHTDTDGRVFLSSGEREDPDPRGRSLREVLYQAYSLRVFPNFASLFAIVILRICESLVPKKNLQIHKFTTCKSGHLGHPSAIVPCG